MISGTVEEASKKIMAELRLATGEALRRQARFWKLADRMVGHMNWTCMTGDSTKHVHMR